jgi:putative inorganic carbon (HCO3(-)) transporter
MARRWCIPHTDRLHRMNAFLISGADTQHDLDMILLYLLIAALPLARHPLWNEYAGEATVIKYVGSGCFAYALLYLGRRKRAPEYFRTAHIRYFGLFFLLVNFSFLVEGSHFRIKDNKFITYWAIALLFFVVVILVDSLAHLRWTLLVTVGSVAFASLYVLRDWQKGSIRPGWVVGDINYFTASATLTLPIAFYLLSSTRARWERLFCASSFALTLGAVIIGASRGGFLGLLAESLFMVWRSQRRLRNLLLMTALLLPLNLLLSTSPLERLLHPREHDQFGADSRVAIWRAGWHMMLSHPLFGVGLEGFKSRVVQYGAPEDMEYIAHNMYLEIGVELGIPSLLAFLAMFITAFCDVEAVRRRTAVTGPVLLQQTALGIQAGLVGFAIAGFFVSAQYQKLFWLILFLAVCLDSLQRHVSRRTRGRPVNATPLSAHRFVTREPLLASEASFLSRQSSN